MMRPKIPIERLHRPSRHKLISKKQRRYIKWMCGSHHLLRAESVARLLVGKDLAELTKAEASCVIQYLERYDLAKERIDSELIERDLGRALTKTKERSTRLNAELYALALLATNRVATPGQLARYV